MRIQFPAGKATTRIQSIHEHSFRGILLVLGVSEYVVA
jgi:hypothetical protein